MRFLAVQIKALENSRLRSVLGLRKTKAKLSRTFNLFSVIAAVNELHPEFEVRTYALVLFLDSSEI